MPKQRRWLVIPREKQAALRGINTARGGKRKFHKKTGVMYLKDKAEAEEVEACYGLSGSRDVLVYEDEKYAHALNGERWEMVRNAKGGDDVKTLHHYTFSGLDSSLLKVWVIRNGKLARVTKALAKKKGYEVVSTSRPRPDREPG